jgi:hypothetical protein
MRATLAVDLKENEMKTTLRLLAVLLCCATATQHVNSLTKDPRKDSSQATLTGCLSGPNHEGVYVLQTGSETVDVGGLAELSKHPGHRVRLTGTWAKNGAEIGEKDPAENKETEQQDREEDAKEKWFKVAAVHMLSKTCTSK